MLLIRLPFLNQAIQGDDVYLPRRGAARADRSAASATTSSYVFLGDAGRHARPLASAAATPGCWPALLAAVRRHPRSPVSRRVHPVLADRGVGDVVAGAAVLAAPAVGDAAVLRRARVRRQRQLARSGPAVPGVLDGAGSPPSSSAASRWRRWSLAAAGLAAYQASSPFRSSPSISGCTAATIALSWLVLLTSGRRHRRLPALRAGLVQRRGPAPKCSPATSSTYQLQTLTMKLKNAVALIGHLALMLSPARPLRHAPARVSRSSCAWMAHLLRRGADPLLRRLRALPAAAGRALRDAGRSPERSPALRWTCFALQLVLGLGLAS